MKRTYVVSLRDGSNEHLKSILIKYLDGVQMLRVEETSALLYMTDTIAQRMRKQHPHLIVEEDIHFRAVGG